MGPEALVAAVLITKGAQLLVIQNQERDSGLGVRCFGRALQANRCATWFELVAGGQLEYGRLLVPMLGGCSTPQSRLRAQAVREMRREERASGSSAARQPTDAVSLLG